MVLAYLRGKLEPGYPEGLRSVIRERLLLHVLSMELEADRGMRRLLIEAAWATYYTPESAVRIYQSGNEAWLRYTSLMELLATQQSKEKPIDEPAKVLLKVFDALETSGLLEQIRQRDMNLAEELE